MNLAYSELLGDADIINREKEQYLAVTADEIQEQAQQILRENNCSTLRYSLKLKAGLASTICQHLVEKIYAITNE